MEKLDPKVCKACLDLLVQWEIKDQSESLEEMENPALKVMLDPEEILVRMDHLDNMDLLDHRVQLASVVLQDHLVQEVSKVCLEPLASLVILEKMELLDFLAKLV
jgi:hypothetical protein